MRKITAFLLSFILAFGILLSSCTRENNQDDKIQEAPPAKTYEHVLVIGVDGAGSYFSETYTPNLDRIFRDGSITYDVAVGSISEKVSSWVSLLHGVDYPVHKITAKNLTAPYPADSEFPSVFRAVREQDPGARIAVACSWPTINDSIVEDGIGIDKITKEENDINLADSVCEYLHENGVPKLMFAAFEEVDCAGHDYGFGSQPHIGAITKTDMLIGAIYDTYRELGVLDDTLVIVTANHGGYDMSHGGNNRADTKVMFAVSGESVIKNGTPKDMETQDVAAVVMYALGLECPENWTSRVPTGIFEGVGGGSRGVYVSADNTRYRETVPTPKKKSKGYIDRFIKDKPLRYYLTLDGHTTDNCGNTVNATGEYFFTDGIFGEGIRLDGGNLTIPDYTVGDSGFTVATWLKIGGMTADTGWTTIITTKDIGWRAGEGFALFLYYDEKKDAIELAVSVGDGNFGKRVYYPIPADHLDGWVHLIFSHNPETNSIKLAFDFGEFAEYVLDEEMRADSFDGLGTMGIGAEIVNEVNSRFYGGMDELMQFDGCFTEEDVAALGEYYGVNK